MIKKIFLTSAILLMSSCVVVTVKHNHINITGNEGDVISEGKNSGSEAADSLNGNAVSPEVGISPLP